MKKAEISFSAARPSVLNICIVLSCAFSALAAAPANLKYQVVPVDPMHWVLETGAPAYQLANLSLKAALDEYESGAVAVHAIEAIKNVTVSVSTFVNEKTKRILPDTAVQIHQVEFVPMDSAGKKRAPLRLLAPRPAALKKDQNTYYWLTLQATHKSDTGLFKGRFMVNGDKAPCTLAVSFYVHPFRLERPEKPRFGAGIGPHNLKMPELRWMKANGLDAVELVLSLGTTFAITNDNGHVVAALNELDTLIKRMRKADMRGPVVFLLGNDRKGHVEIRICEKFPQFRIDTSAAPIYGKKKVYGPIGDPVFDTLYLSAIGQIKSSVEKYGIELTPIIFDEAVERFMPELPARFNLIRSRFPKMRIVGVPMGRLQWVKQLAPFSDIIWMNGGFQENTYFLEKIRKDYWFYTFTHAVDEPGAIRANCGLRFWKYRPSMVWFYGYNQFSGDPFVEYDGEFPESSIRLVYPCLDTARGVPTHSPAWIGFREAVDDWSYVMMLEDLAGKKGRLSRYPLKDLKMAMADFDYYDFNEDGMPMDFTVMDSIRTLAAGWILDLMRK